MKNLRIAQIIIALSLASFLIAGCGKKTPDPSVSIGISPASQGIDLGRPQTFTVTVTGSDNKGYTVTASPAATAGCPTGTQSANTFTCTPTEARVYSISATASADTSKSASALLTVSAPFSAAPPTASTVCSDPIGTGTNRLRIAVASNFYSPAQNMVRDRFQASSYGTNTSVIVCHNSTGTLRTEINGGYQGYGMFFAADETASNFDAAGRTSFVYASGIPVLAAKKDVIPNVSGLIDGLPAGELRATIPDADLSTFNLNIASAQKVSVADPGQAPYGVAAQRILNNMMGANIPTTLPSWVFSDGNVAANGLWNNIDNTFAAVNTNSVAGKDTSAVNSGIIGKSQICDNIAPKAANPTWVYVEFTNPNFIRNQKAILLDSGNPAASKLDEYIKSAMSSNAWTEFLAANCYNPVP